MCDSFATAWVLHGEIEGIWVDNLRIHTPTLRRIRKGPLQLYEFLQIIVVIDRLLNNAIMAVIPHREHACAATQGFC